MNLTALFGRRKVDSNSAEVFFEIHYLHCVVRESGGLMTLGTDERDPLSTSHPASRRVADAEVQVWRHT